MNDITIHRADSNDFSASGLGLLRPLDMTVSWVLNGMYQLDATFALNDPMAALLEIGAVIVAPVPAQETPSLSAGASAGTSAARDIYKVRTNGGNLHLRSGPGTNYKILKKYKNGTEVVLLEKTNASWYRIAVPDGASGYMSTQYLQFVRTETQTIPGASSDAVIAPKPVRAQPFRIHRVEPGILTVGIHARHIFYDLSDNLLLPHTYKNVTRQSAMNAFLTRCLNAEHGFHAYCEGTETATLEYTEPGSPTVALLGSDGLIDRLGGEVMMDWYDVYVTDRLGRDRGVSVRYGKNLTQVGGSIDGDGMTTRIVPIGQAKNGEDLYLPETFIEAPDDGTKIWAHPRYATLRVEDAREGDGMSRAQAYEKMRAAAREQFEQGAAQATASIAVEFVETSRLVSAEDQARLQKLFPGDDVLVKIDPMGITAKMRLAEYVYDCLRGRYRSVTLGTAGRDIASTGIDPRQLPGAGITASKLANAAVTAKQLSDGAVKSAKIEEAAIGIAHISDAAVNQLSANALSAVRADIHELVAGSVTTDQLYADLAALALAQIQNAEIDSAQIKDLTAQIAEISKAHLIDTDIEWANIDRLNALVADVAQAKIENAVISAAQIDDLSAVIAQAIHLEAGTGAFALAEVKNLLSGALILREGLADSMMIENLAVTSANMLNATIDRLVIRGSDGKYYRVQIDSSGGIAAEETTVTSEEIAAGETTDGRQITATTANVSALNASTVKASQAILTTIFAESLTAGRITAGEALIASATIPTLYATSIEAIGNTLNLSANESVRIMVGAAAQKAEDAQATADNSVASVITLYARNDSRTVPPMDESAWSTAHPEYQEGMAIWQRTVTTLNSGAVTKSDPVCISGADGEPATTLRLDSSRGTVFKNSAVSTVLSAVIYRGGKRITDPDALRAELGASAHLQWKWQRLGETGFGSISSSDARLSNGGFQFTLTPADVDTKVTFLCELIL